jgi:UDP-glucose 4-epimerase
MSKMIVTGGAGFIGSHTVVELVAAGHEPVIVDDLRNSEEIMLAGLDAIMGHKPRVYRVDCNDRVAFERVFAAEGPIAGVLHFAADKAVGESVADPLKYYQNNIGSLAVLLQLMQDHDVRHLVFSSSCTVYGQPEVLPVSESCPDRNSSSPYGYTKVVCEQMLRDMVVAWPELKAVLLRYFNPIGAHPSGLIGELPIGVPSNLVPFVTQAAAGKHALLTVNGTDYDTPDGSCVRDYIHVVDVARAHVQAMRWLEDRPAPVCEAFNLGTGRGHSVLEVLARFQAVSGVELAHEEGPRRAGDVASIYADTHKANEVLGWKAQHALDDALRDAWNWEQHLAERLVKVR